MPVVHSRGHCKSLRPIFLPLQIACSFTCSVASLGQSPHHYLPGLHGLRHGALADYLLGQGRPSTCPTGLTEVPDTTSPHSHMGDRRMRPLPDEEKLILKLFFACLNEKVTRPATQNSQGSPTLAAVKEKEKSGDPESNQGPSDCCRCLQSDALPTELSPACLLRIALEKLSFLFLIRIALLKPPQCKNFMREVHVSGRQTVPVHDPKVTRMHGYQICQEQ